jgi:hypothetical protein
MNVETVPIDSIHADPANVRRHPDRNLDAIRASLARFGQQKPLVGELPGHRRCDFGGNRPSCRRLHVSSRDAIYQPYPMCPAADVDLSSKKPRSTL